MRIFWKPNGGSWTNTGPTGFGELFDSVECTIRKGFFRGFKLNDQNGTLIDYSSNCVSYTGSFTDDSKSGDFVVFEISQPAWETATGVGGNGVAAATKKIITYSNDVATAELSSESIQLRIECVKSDTGCITHFNINT